jgi:TonB family protein
VKPLTPTILLIVAFTANTSLCGNLEQKKGASANSGSNKKQVVHLVVGVGSNLKQNFTYCPFPTLPWEYGSEYQPLKISGAGTYRLIVDQQGNVTEIKILKPMGALGDSRADVAALKTLVRWRAKPGPDRIVDVMWGLPWSARVITTKNQTGSHIPLH